MEINKDIFDLIKKGFLNFTIQKSLYDNGVQIVYKIYDNKFKKEQKLKNINVETFQFITKIKGTYRSILLNKKSYKDNSQEDSYFIKGDENSDLINFRDKEFVNILNMVLRKEKIKNVLEEL